MAQSKTRSAASVGVAEQGNSAVLVTVAASGEVLDRRRIDLTEPGLPTHPHHHEGSWAVGRYLNTPGARVLTLAEAVALVDQVRASAARGARDSLAALIGSVSVPIASIALRLCPELPPTTEERIIDHHAQTMADSVMYREALASAAEARGWSVFWYDREGVFLDAAAVLGRKEIQPFLQAMGRTLGPPWQAQHRLAAAAALAAFGGNAMGTAPAPAPEIAADVSRRTQVKAKARMKAKPPSLEPAKGAQRAKPATGAKRAKVAQRTQVAERAKPATGSKRPEPSLQKPKRSRLAPLR